MTPRYPGAVWMPSGQDIGANNGPVAFSWHEAVTTGTKEAIAGWVSQSNACHAFVGEHGDTAQYKDFDRAAYGVLEGNYRGVVTIETWDNLLHGSELTPDGRDANHSEWDAGQCERIADMIAWADVALGIPIHWMANTRERGHAPHRRGVPEAGGSVDIGGWGPDRWTSHPGKSCPGDMRVVCLRDVAIPRARVIAAAVRAGRCTWLPTGPVNLAAALARTGGTPAPVTPAKPAPAKLDEDENTMRTLSVAGYHPVIGYGPGLFIHLNGDQLAEGKRLGQIGAGGVTTLARADEVQAWAESFGAGPKNIKGKASAYIKDRPSVPAKPAPAPAPKPATDAVRPGETLTAFAARHKTTVAAVVAANRAKITNPDVINAGQVLNIPK